MSYSFGKTILGWKRVPATRVAMASNCGLAGEDFDLAGAGEFGEVDGASAADAGGGGLVGGDGGKLGQELAGVDEEGF